MLLDDLKENDIVVFSDGSCSEVTAYNKNDQAATVSIVFNKAVFGIRGYPKKFCWIYRLDGSLWNALKNNNDIVKVIHA